MDKLKWAFWLSIMAIFAFGLGFFVIKIINQGDALLLIPLVTCAIGVCAGAFGLIQDLSRK